MTSLRSVPSGEVVVFETPAGDVRVDVVIATCGAKRLLLCALQSFAPILLTAARATIPGVDTELCGGLNIDAYRRKCPSWRVGRAEMKFSRITVHPDQMRGAPCIRGLPIAVATVVEMVNDGMTVAQILEGHPDLTAADVREALAFEARRVETLRAEIEADLAAANEYIAAHGSFGDLMREHSAFADDDAV